MYQLAGNNGDNNNVKLILLKASSVCLLFNVRLWWDLQQQWTLIIWHLIKSFYDFIFFEPTREVNFKIVKTRLWFRRVCVVCPTDRDRVEREKKSGVNVVSQRQSENYLWGLRDSSQTPSEIEVREVPNSCSLLT